MSKTKKTITVRRQKIKKNHVREKLIFFTILVLILLVIAAFARKLCPYDPDMQDLLLAQKPPSAEHILGTYQTLQFVFQSMNSISALFGKHYLHS